MKAHEIEYKIQGGEMQMLSVILDPQESVISEAGAMMMMSSGIEMESIAGDGSKENSGFLDAAAGMGKRLLVGESLFITLFTNKSRSRQFVTFAAPYPGKILAIDLKEHQNQLISQKDSFLCAAKGVSLDIAFNKKIGAGIFGGEGFIMQKMEGDGLVFVHAGGNLVKKDLQAGEILRIDTGCLVAMTKDIDYDIQAVGGIKTALFGGEGLFLATLKGPGTVWLQSIPFNRMADKIIAASSMGGSSRNLSEESSAAGLINNIMRGI